MTDQPSWLPAARQVVETQTFVTVNLDGQIIPTDWRALETSELDEWDRAEPIGGEGMILDLFSASAMCQVYDGLNETNRARFAAMPITQAHGIAMRILQGAE